MEGRDAPLYRGIRDLKFAVQALQSNTMPGHTTQRWWPDGKRRKENDPEYQGSYWMKGVSFTRDKRYAEQWGAVVFHIDQRVLANNTKLVPFNWGYSIPSDNHHKREREEFAVTRKNPDTYRNPPEYDGDPGSFDNQRFHAPEGDIKNLDKMLLGIYLDSTYQSENYAGNEAVQYLINHPKFRGYYVFKRRGD